VTMFSGCRDDQTSADASIGGSSVGAMSWAFLEVMKRNPNPTYLNVSQVLVQTFVPSRTSSLTVSCADVAADKDDPRSKSLPASASAVDRLQGVGSGAAFEILGGSVWQVRLENSGVEMVGRISWFASAVNTSFTALTDCMSHERWTSKHLEQNES